MAVATCRGGGRICLASGLQDVMDSAEPRSAGHITAAEEFTEFATGAAPRLRRTAFLLCGNWHTAEDLAQTALCSLGNVKSQNAQGQDADQGTANPFALLTVPDPAHS